MVLALLLGACTIDDPDAAGDTAGDTDPATTTGSVDGTATTTETSTTSVSSTVDESGGADTSALHTCEEPQPLPPAPVDCSGADGVIDHDVYVEPQSGHPAEALEGVVRVEGSIYVNRTDLTNLDFMACVQEVTGSITIYDNDQLTNVDGLWSVTTLGADFVFSENGSLADFDGLPNVVEIPGALVIKNNDGMQSLSGLHQLEAVGDLYVQSNPALRDIDGLGGLQVVGGMFAVTNNASLCLSSVNCVGLGIIDPAEPREEWSARANDEGC